MLTDKELRELYEAAQSHLLAIMGMLESEKEDDKETIESLFDDIHAVTNNINDMDSIEPLESLIAKIQYVIAGSTTLSKKEISNIEAKIDLIFKDTNFVISFLKDLAITAHVNPDDITEVEYKYQENQPLKMTLLKRFLVDVLGVTPFDENEFWLADSDPKFIVKYNSVNNFNKAELRSKWFEMYSNLTTIKESELYRKVYKTEASAKRLEEKIERDIASLNAAVQKDPRYKEKRACAENLKIAAPLLDAFVFPGTNPRKIEFKRYFESQVPDSERIEFSCLIKDIQQLKAILDAHAPFKKPDPYLDIDEEAESSSHTNHPKEQFKGALQLLRDWDPTSNTVPYMLSLMTGMTDNVYETKGGIPYELSSGKWIDDRFNEIFMHFSQKSVMTRLLAFSKEYNYLESKVKSHEDVENVAPQSTRNRPLLTQLDTAPPPAENSYKRRASQKTEPADKQAKDTPEINPNKKLKM